MATIRKKAVKKAAAKNPATAKKNAPPKKAASGDALRRELAEAREQQAATGDILRMIARSWKAIVITPLRISARSQLRPRLARALCSIARRPPAGP